MKLPKLSTVLNNRIREMQSNRHKSESHNTLSVEELFWIFDYLNEHAISSAEAYRDRLVFAVGLATGPRSTELLNLMMYQLPEKRSEESLASSFTF